MNFRQYKKKHKLTKQPYELSHKGDIACPCSWTTARRAYNKGHQVNFLPIKS